MHNSGYHQAQRRRTSPRERLVVVYRIDARSPLSRILAQALTERRTVTLDLPEHPGEKATCLFCDEEVYLRGEPFDLEPYGFRWFRVRAA